MRPLIFTAAIFLGIGAMAADGACRTDLENFVYSSGDTRAADSVGMLEASMSDYAFEGLWKSRETRYGRLSAMTINVGSSIGAASVSANFSWKALFIQLSIKLSHSPSPVADKRYLLKPLKLSSEKSEAVLRLVTNCNQVGNFPKDEVENVGSMVMAAELTGKLPEFLGQCMKYLKFGNPEKVKNSPSDEALDAMPFSRRIKYAPI